jgi:hypothetical protein
MISFEEALRIRTQYCKNEALPVGDFIERESFWWFTTDHFIGGQGIIIDKSDGHVQALGTSAGLSVDDWFFVHELGFRHLRYSLHISSIRDEPKALQLLLETMQFRRIPAFDVQLDWTSCQFLPRIISTDFFDSRFVVTACQDKNCSSIGTVIWDSKNRAKLGRP